MKRKITDTDRIDWLEKNARNTSGNCDRDPSGYYDLRIADGTHYYKCAKRLNFRDAIDAEIKQSNT